MSFLLSSTKSFLLSSLWLCFNDLATVWHVIKAYICKSYIAVLYSFLLSSTKWQMSFLLLSLWICFNDLDTIWHLITAYASHILLFCRFLLSSIKWQMSFLLSSIKWQMSFLLSSTKRFLLSSLWLCFNDLDTIWHVIKAYASHILLFCTVSYLQNDNEFSIVVIMAMF